MKTAWLSAAGLVSVLVALLCYRIHLLNTELTKARHVRDTAIIERNAALCERELLQREKQSYIDSYVTCSNQRESAFRQVFELRKKINAPQ